MQYILTLSVLVSVWLTGCALAIMLRRKNYIEILGLGFILGTLIFTLFELLVHQYLHIVISREFVLSLSFLCTLFSSMYLFFQKRYIKQNTKTIFFTIQRSSAVVKVLVGILFVLFANSLLQNYFWPVTDWDALALYDFRARIVALTGSFQDGIQLGYFFQYPPFTSLLHTNLYVVGFERVKVWYGLLYISLAFVFYALLRKQTSQLISLLATILLVTNPLILEHATMAYTNLSHTIFLSLGILYIVDWFRERTASTLVLGSILVMGSTWVRMSEPFWILPIILLICIAVHSLFKKMSFRYSVASVVGIAIIYLGRQIWPRFVSQLYPPQIPSERATATLTAIPIFGMFIPYIQALISLQPSFIVQRIGEIWSYSTVYIYPVFIAYLLPAVFLLYFDIQKKSLHLVFLWAMLLSYLLLLFVGTFVFSLSDTSWSAIGGSANRMSMFLIPLFIFALGSSHSIQLWIRALRK